MTDFEKDALKAEQTTDENEMDSAELETDVSLGEVEAEGESTDVGEEDGSVDESAGTKSIKPSKEQSAIVKLKRELKEYKDKLAQAEEARTAQQSETTKEKIAKSYKDRGYDDESAMLMAERDYKLEAMEHKFAKFEFQSTNADVLAKYPQASANIDKIMKNAKATGMTAEQICRGMFGQESESPERKRAVDAVTGQLESNAASGAVAGATRTEGTAKGVSLNANDMRNKAELEARLGKTLTNERFKELAERYL